MSTNTPTPNTPPTNGCPHGPGAHYLGDPGDTDTIRDACWQQRTNTKPHNIITNWLTNIGAI